MSTVGYKKKVPAYHDNPSRLLRRGVWLSSCHVMPPLAPLWGSGGSGGRGGCVLWVLVAAVVVFSGVIGAVVAEI